ncbi:MAG: hypothetical protein PUE16_03555, partial [Lactimicrobium massiliense]
MREKLNSQDAQTVLFLGDEEEFFPDEIKEIILSILDEALCTCKEQSRRNDVVKDLLDHNSYGHVCQKQIKELMTGYSVMSSALRGALMDLGIHIQED